MYLLASIKWITIPHLIFLQPSVALMWNHATQTGNHVRTKTVGDVTVVDVLSPELRHPGPAVEFGAELQNLVADGHTRLLLDFRNTRYLCSTAFAVLVKLAKSVQDARGKLVICNMNADVLVGANIIGLSRLVEIHEDCDSALEAF